MIAFVPHVGMNLATGESEDLKQDRIFVDGLHVGYVGHEPGSYIQLIKPVSEVEQTEIEARLLARHGKESPTAGPPPEISQEALDALEGNDDE